MSYRQRATGNELGILICQSMGIDPDDVASMVLRLEPGQPAYLEAKVFIGMDEAGEIAQHVSRYKVEHIKTGKPPAGLIRAINEAKAKADGVQGTTASNLEPFTQQPPKACGPQAPSGNADAARKLAHRIREAAAKAEAEPGSTTSESIKAADAGLSASTLLDPLEQAIDQATRLVSEATGALAERLSRHLDSLLDMQLGRLERKEMRRADG